MTLLLLLLSTPPLSASWAYCTKDKTTLGLNKVHRIYSNRLCKGWIEFATSLYLFKFRCMSIRVTIVAKIKFYLLLKTVFIQFFFVINYEKSDTNCFLFNMYLSSSLPCWLAFFLSSILISELSILIFFWRGIMSDYFALKLRITQNKRWL